MTNLPSSGQSTSMDNVAVTREDFRQDIGEFLQYTAQALGNVTGTYTTEVIDPTAVILRGSPTIAATAEPLTTDTSLRLANTRWVKYNANSAGTTAPTNPADGQSWVDLSQDPPVLKIWDDTNTAWVTAGGSVSVPDASETVKGIVELATAAETTTGTSNTLAVHPAGLKVELDKKLNLAGGNLTGGVTQTERTITAGAFNLATGNLWTAGAITVPNPTNAVAGMSGLIRFTAAPTGWGGNFSTAPNVTVVPSIVPFFVESPTSIRLGQAVGVA